MLLIIVLLVLSQIQLTSAVDLGVHVLECIVLLKKAHVTFSSLLIPELTWKLSISSAVVLIGCK